LQEFARQRLEGHHHRRQRQPRGMRSQALDQYLMTQVQAIEAADRDDAIARIDRFESANELHDPLSSSHCPCAADR